MSWADVIGACVCLTAPIATFDRGKVLLREHPSGRLVRVCSWGAPGHASSDFVPAPYQGYTIVQRDWDRLVKMEVAISFAPRPVEAGTLAVWAVGGFLPDRASFVEAMAPGIVDQVATYEPMPGKRTDAYLVRESSLAGLRETRAEQALEAGVRLLQAGDPAAACRHAEIAQALSPKARPEHMALLIVGYARAGLDRRCVGMLRVVEQSYDRSFVEQVQAACEGYEKSLQTEGTSTC